MPICLKTAEQFVKEHHLARRLHESVHCIQILVIPTVLLLGCAEEERVVAALLELDDNVQEGDLRTLALHRMISSEHVFRHESVYLLHLKGSSPPLYSSSDSDTRPFDKTGDLREGVTK